MIIIPTKFKINIARSIYFIISRLRKILGKKNEGIFKRNEINWNLTLSEGIDFSIFLRGSFEPEVIKAYKLNIKQNDTILDIGANIGAHTLPLANLVGNNGRIIAIEPTIYAYNKLLDNIQLNPNLSKQITSVHSYLAESNEDSIEGQISSRWPIVNEKLTNQTDHGGIPESTMGAAVTTVDQLVKDHNIKNLNWVKLDVDGNELKILKGAKKTMDTFSPGIFMEIAPSCHKGNNYQQFYELINLLESTGYTMTRLKDNKALRLDPEVLIKTIPENASINVLLAK